MFHSFHRQVNIVFTKDGIRTLVNFVIANPIRVDLLCQYCATRRFVAFEIVQAKERNYHDQHPIDHFLPFAIEVFGCLNKKVDMFLHNCTKPCGTSKGIRPSSFCLGYFSPSKNFNYTAKDANILHLKLDDSNRSSYFLTSTPSKRTPHHHGWPPTSGWLLRQRDFNIYFVLASRLIN
jgi:hypothetical protein